MIADILEKKSVQQYTLEEYFELEEKAAFKSEFCNGKIVKIPGGTFEHAQLSSNVVKILGKLEADRFETLNSDQKIFITDYNRIVYADAMVLVGKPNFHEGNRQLLTNPTIVIEVLSDSTERYDRSGKFRKYQTLPSFKDYVLIDQKRPIVDVLHKEGERDWRMKTYIGLEEEIYLKSIDITLKMSDIYKNVENLKDPQSVLNFELDDE
jgi:Uma2 family endonuclease